MRNKEKKLLRLILFLVLPLAVTALLISRGFTQQEGLPQVNNILTTSFIHAGDSFISFNIYTSSAEGIIEQPRHKQVVGRFPRGKSISACLGKSWRLFLAT